MKRMKTIPILLLAALMLLSALGCQSADKAPEAAQTPAPQETAAPEPTQAPTLEPVEPTPEPVEETPDPVALIAEAEITAGRHDREEGFSSPFKTYCIDTPVAAVHLEDGAGYSDETLRAFAETVVSDVVRIGAYTGREPEKVTVYVVERMLKDRPVLLRDRVFCTAADLESGVYREALCGACCGLSIPWKQIGLSECVFGTVDESGLRDYYADEAHALTASCAAVYLLPAVADAETVEAATNTAASLTAFMLENEGFDAFKAAESTAEALPAWAERLGIEPPVLPDGSAQAARMTAESDRKYLCVIRTDNFTINVTEGAFAQTPDELYAFVCKLYYGMEFVLKDIREELPSYAELAETRFAEGVIIDLIIPTQEQVSRASNQNVWIITEGVVWHEIVHVLLRENVNRTDLWWQCEALADHFSYSAVSHAIPWEDEADYDAMFAGREDIPAYYLVFWRTVWPVFRAEREADVSLPAGFYSDHARARAMGIGELLLEDNPLVRGDDSTIAGARGRDAGDMRTDGNAMTYFEATVMLEYLFDVYGAETAVAGYMDGRPLSETFGKDYPELFAEFFAYLTETYEPMLEQN